jgi:hypothetical protein
MPLNQKIGHIETTSERRASSRTKTQKGALLYFGGNAGVFSCTVRDVTNAGAGIRIQHLTIMPLEIGLSFDNFQTVCMCRLIWRQSNFLGVSFES